MERDPDDSCLSLFNFLSHWSSQPNQVFHHFNQHQLPGWFQNKILKISKISPIEWKSSSWWKCRRRHRCRCCCCRHQRHRCRRKKWNSWGFSHFCKYIFAPPTMTDKQMNQTLAVLEKKSCRDRKKWNMWHCTEFHHREMFQRLKPTQISKSPNLPR